MNRAFDDPRDPYSGTALKLERGIPPDGGRTGAWLVFLGGWAFLVGCGWLIFDAWRNSTLNYIFHEALGVLLGLVAIYWQWRPLMLMCRTALPSGEISPRMVTVGDEFTFRYQQPVRLPLRADVTASLVLRETITRKGSDGETSQVIRDHLVAAHTEKGLEVPAGGSLQIQCTFRLPDETSDFPVSNWPVKSVIKVRVQTGRGAGYWEEFSLPVPVGVSSQVGASRAAEADYQVTLVSFPNLYSGLPAPAPLDEYLPHLDRVDRLPLVLLRGITRAEAGAACRRLEAAGAVVELACGGRVIERQQVHNLPVPTETVRMETQGLPIPGATPDGSA